MSSRRRILDSLLPLINPEQNELHLNATILEVAEAAQLAADAKFRRYLLGRLSDTVALVDPGCGNALEDALLAAGQTPKIA